MYECFICVTICLYYKAIQLTFFILYKPVYDEYNLIGRLVDHKMVDLSVIYLVIHLVESFIAAYVIVNIKARLIVLPANHFAIAVSIRLPMRLGRA